jgi:hypothetical protein
MNQIALEKGRLEGKKEKKRKMIIGCNYNDSKQQFATICKSKSQ